jgi:signal transduction histidine kinase
VRGIRYVDLIKQSRGVGIRIAAITMLLVVISMVVPAAVIGSYIDTALERHVGSLIDDEMEQLLEADKPTVVADAAAAVERLTNAEVSREFAYRLMTSDGTHIAGDKWLNGVRVGWNRTTLRDPNNNGSDVTHFLILTRPLGKGHILSVGRNIQWIGTVEHELRKLMVWGLVGGLAMAAITAFLVNRLIASRLKVISATAVAIMDGRLSTRIPITGADDDFDRLSTTLNDALSRNQDLVQSLEQVSSDIAHDLRTPLGRLLQGLERARNEAASTEEFAAAIERAIAEAAGLLTTFTALLRIAQMESGSRRTAQREVHLAEVLASVAEAYELSAEESGHQLKTQISDEGKIRGDRDLLVQMFANLIENSLTHTPSGTTIVVALAATPDAVVASVSDDGPGVMEHELERIFQRFYRLEASRTSPGTGLGLSLVAAVAKLHDATLKSENTNPGLRISVSFSRP